MPARAAAVLPFFARAREALEDCYDLMASAGVDRPIVCQAISAYQATREKLLGLEKVAIEEAKRAGLHPPETAPRSLGSFGNCPPGRSEVTITKASSVGAKKHVEAVKKLADAADKAYLAEYKKNSAFQTAADRLITALAPVISPAEAATEAGIGALRLLFYLGGSPWTIAESEKLLGMAFSSFEEAEVAAIYEEAGAVLRACREFYGFVREDLKKQQGFTMKLVLGSAAILGLTLAGTATYYFTRPKAEPEPAPRKRRSKRVDVIDTEGYYQMAGSEPLGLPPRRG